MQVIPMTHFLPSCLYVVLVIFWNLSYDGMGEQTCLMNSIGACPPNQALYSVAKGEGGWYTAKVYGLLSGEWWAVPSQPV